MSWMLLLVSLSTASAGVAGEYISLTACADEWYHPPGTELRAKVGWDSGEPVDGLRTWICWDESLEFVEVEWADAWPIQSIAVDPNGLFIECLGWQARHGETACTLVFQIRADAELGFAWLNFREHWPLAQLLADDYWWTVGTRISWGTIVTPLGDMNCDGAVNSLDIDPFVAALSGDATYDLVQPACNRLLADCNADGTLDAGDIDAFVDLLNPET